MVITYRQVIVILVIQPSRSEQNQDVYSGHKELFYHPRSLVGRKVKFYCTAQVSTNISMHFCVTLSCQIYCSIRDDGFNMKSNLFNVYFRCRSDSYYNPIQTMIAAVIFLNCYNCSLTCTRLSFVSSIHVYYAIKLLCYVLLVLKGVYKLRCRYIVL